MLGKYIAHCEDSLTASVFSHLLHLPSELFWQILRSACYSKDLPVQAGEPEQVDYWPKWDAAGTEHNNTYVAPDAFVRFEAFDLIIEAKRPKDGQQKKDQWERELIAYTNQYGEQRRSVRMLALGGIRTPADERLTHRWQASQDESGTQKAETHEFVCPVHMCRWTRLLQECKRMEKELRSARYASAQGRAHRRILADLIALFAAHGLQTGKWFAELVPKLPRLDSKTVSHQSLFQTISSRFPSR